MLLSIAMNKLRAWRAYQETVYQLECLQERELSDLGIARRDIKNRAREATRARTYKAGSPTPKMRLPQANPAR